MKTIIILCYLMLNDMVNLQTNQLYQIDIRNWDSTFSSFSCSFLCDLLLPTHRTVATVLRRISRTIPPKPRTELNLRTCLQAIQLSLFGILEMVYHIQRCESGPHVCRTGHLSSLCGY